MIPIRLKERDEAKAWRAMIDIGPVTIIGRDPVYVVQAVQLELLVAKGFWFEVIPPRLRKTPRTKHAKRK
jgi:hypothetical protein